MYMCVCVGVLNPSNDPINFKYVFLSTFRFRG